MADRAVTVQTTLMEPGSGSKDTDCVLDELICDLIAMCGDSRPAVMFVTNDCGPLQLNQFQVQFARFLVDVSHKPLRNRLCARAAWSC